jgi:hypothetical protein
MEIVKKYRQIGTITKESQNGPKCSQYLILMHQLKRME